MTQKSELTVKDHGYIKYIISIFKTAILPESSNKLYLNKILRAPVEPLSETILRKKKMLILSNYVL